MNRKSHLCVAYIAGLFVSLGAINASLGSTLIVPAASCTEEEINSNGHNGSVIDTQQTPGTYSGTATTTENSGNFISTGTGEASITFNYFQAQNLSLPDPEVEAISSLTQSGAGYVYAQEGLGYASLTYYYVVGYTGTGSPAETVPVLVNATSEVGVSYSGDSAISEFAITGFDGQIQQYNATTNNSLTLTDRFSTPAGDDITAEVSTAGDEIKYSVTMYVDATCPQGAIGEATGYVDPTLEVDPSFADASDYSVFVSPQLVPEPSSICLLAVSAIGLLRRRRRIAL